MAVPTVVGVEGAVTRFPPGTAVVVDGTTGEVAVTGEREAAGTSGTPRGEVA
jgi:pyruvate,water dikinase